MPSSKKLQAAFHGSKNKKRKFEQVERAASPEPDNKDQEIKFLVERLQERDQKIEDLKKQLERSDGILDLRAQVITQEKTIEDLQKQVAEMKANLKAMAAEQNKFKYALDDMAVLKTQMADLKRTVEIQDDDGIAGTTANKVLELGAEISEMREQASGNWEKLGDTIKGFQK